LFTKKRLFTRLITVKNPDDLAKIQFLTKNTDIIFTHEICGLARDDAHEEDKWIYTLGYPVLNKN